MPPVETPGFSLDPRLAADSEAVARIGLCELRLMNDRRWPWVLLVPQRAVTELLDKQFVTVIGPDNRAEQRLVELGERVGQFWIVKSGLKPGERIIVDGTQKAPPGTVVAPEMLSETEADQAAKK